MLVYFVGT